MAVVTIIAIGPFQRYSWWSSPFGNAGVPVVVVDIVASILGLGWLLSDVAGVVVGVCHVRRWG